MIHRSALLAVLLTPTPTSVNAFSFNRSRSRSRSVGFAIQTPSTSLLKSSEDTNDMYWEAKARSEYLNWAVKYGKERSEKRFINFSRNLAEMEAFSLEEGMVMELNEYADLSVVEFEKMFGSDMLEEEEETEDIPGKVTEENAVEATSHTSNQDIALEPAVENVTETAADDVKLETDEPDIESEAISDLVENVADSTTEDLKEIEEEILETDEPNDESESMPDLVDSQVSASAVVEKLSEAAPSVVEPASFSNNTSQAIDEEEMMTESQSETRIVEKESKFKIPSINIPKISFDDEARKAATEAERAELQKIREEQARKAEEMAAARKEALEAAKAARKAEAAETARKVEDEKKKRQAEQEKILAEQAAEAEKVAIAAVSFEHKLDEIRDVFHQ